MKNRFFFLLIPLQLFSQEVKQVIDNDNYPFTEVYYVLKTNENTRHGLYQKYVNKEILVTSGFYKNGRKDSLWIEYWSLNNKKVVGNYKKSTKVGEWVFYNYNGEIDQKYNFTTNEITYFKVNDDDKNKEYKILLDTITIMSRVERPPLVIGGIVSLHESISDKIEYPRIAREKGIMGIVYISFMVDENGDRYDFKVEKGIGAGCDEEALRVVEEMNKKWLPAILSGKKVKVVYTLPISFTLR